MCPSTPILKAGFTIAPFARIIGARTRISHEYDHTGWLDRRLVNRSLPRITPGLV